ncbi:MAG TPA: hypothetical protein VN428_18245 [Bryobacteraceae bacterium]|nr:hypothetical protein [Bryobacteraceae bacterium]
MRITRKALWRMLAGAAGLTLAAGLIAPRLDADRFGTRVKESLEAALGRRVEIQGKVRLDVFGGPGFSVEKVVIHDDPAVSLEPLAYMESLEARVSFASFWTGRLQFSNLRLVNPSLNLARHSERGELNLAPLVGRTVVAPSGSSLPEIEVRGGRINFKLDDTKSIVYLTDVSLDVSPPSSPGGEWRVRLQGAPARTDRATQRYGLFRARAAWRPDAATGGTVNGSMELERSSLGEWIRLVHGHDIGIHGQVTSRARFHGPVSNIEIEGRVEVSDIHRWDLLPPYWGYWPFDYKGTLDMSGQTLEVDTTGGGPVRIAVRASGILGKSAWGARAAFAGVPLAGATAMAGQMGLAAPSDLNVGGDITGVVAYSPGSGIAGMAVASGVAFEIAGKPPVRIPKAELVLDGPTVRLAPAATFLGPEAPVRFEAEYSWRTQVFDGVMTAKAAGIPETTAAVGLAGGAPVLEQCSKGTWKGLLRYQKRPEQAGQWSGVVEIQDAVLEVDGLAGPVKLASARVALREPGAVVDRIRGQAGAATFTGDYRYRADATRPHQLRLSIAAVEAAELERLLAPALRRDEGFLTRALRLGRTRLPGWLSERHAEATFNIAEVTIPGLPLGRVRGHLRWDGADLQVPELSALIENGGVVGDFRANLRGPAPVYRFQGRFHEVVWSGGEWEGTGTLNTWGMGSQLLRNLRVETGFAGRSIAMTPDARFKTLSGQCAFSLARGVPVLHLTKLQATVGDDTFEGKGATSADGRLNLDLSGPERELRLTGTLSPFRLEPRP